MIIVPEIETVVLLVPRTGSGSLYRAVMAKYPRAMLLYRHMEADGIPFAYDRWRKVGVVRHPVARLWSFYKFTRSFDSGCGVPDYDARLRLSAARPFVDWLLNNETTFTNQNVFERGKGYTHFARYAVLHSLPENRKSQWHYLRPDLGTVIYPFGARARLAAELGIEMGHFNATVPSDAPDLTAAARCHMRQVFAWDYAAIGADAP